MPKNTRLAYLCSCYPAVSHTFILREIEGLQKQGVEVHPFSMRPGHILEGASDFEKQQLAETWCILGQGLVAVLVSQFSQLIRSPFGYLGGIFFALTLHRGCPRETLWALFHFAEAAMLARQMRKRHLKHVHVHFAGPETHVALYASRAFGITYSFTLHGPDHLYNVALGNLEAKIEHAAFVICISHYATSQVLRLAGPDALSRTHIVHCGVDPAQFSPVHRQDSFQERPFTIVCTGRLTPTKGQALLVLSCAELLRHGRKLRCYLIGSGSEMQTLQKMIDEHDMGDSVILTGALPQEGVRQHLAEADLFVLPSFAEGVPVVLMEAMSMEIPCITTRVGGIAELIEDGHDSWLVHAGDTGTLTERLKTAMDNPEALPEMGRQARAKIISEFHIAGCTTLLASIYEKRL